MSEALQQKKDVMKKFLMRYGNPKSNRLVMDKVSCELNAQILGHRQRAEE
jgi:hypothetical protein